MDQEHTHAHCTECLAPPLLQTLWNSQKEMESVPADIYVLPEHCHHASMMPMGPLRSRHWVRGTDQAAVFAMLNVFLHLWCISPISRPYKHSGLHRSASRLAWLVPKHSILTLDTCLLMSSRGFDCLFGQKYPPCTKSKLCIVIEVQCHDTQLASYDRAFPYIYSVWSHFPCMYISTLCIHTYPPLLAGPQGRWPKRD